MGLEGEGEDEKIKKNKYLKWILKVERRTSDYLLMEELQKEKIRKGENTNELV